MQIEFSALPQAAKVLCYRELSAMPFNFEAVFSDESPEYIDIPVPEPGQSVTVRLRVYRGQDAVVLLRADGRDISMIKKEPEGYFDYYSASFNVYGRTAYRFVIRLNGDEYFYNKKGICRDEDANYDFTIIPGFRTPDWAKGAVMYQIYVDRFYNGDLSNDVVNNEYAYLGLAAKQADSWNDRVQSDDICRFYGGDIQGVIDKMPYLSKLGVEAVYFNPLFVSPSTHKYDIQDYDHIDPHLGVIVNDGGEPLYFERFKNKFATQYMLRTTDPENLRLSDELFIELVEEAHKNGIKVILDGVFNHCGAFNKWLDSEGFYEQSGYPPGAYRDRNSSYTRYFKWNGGGSEDYDCWWGHKNHPKLNYEESPELYRYIMEVARKWVSPPFNADGWRLDVAADLGYSPEVNHRFWQDFRNTVKAANPNAIILAEHYGDPSQWLAGGQWDAVMNYDAFMEPVSWFLCGMEKHSQEYKPELVNNTGAFVNSMRYYMARFTRESLLAAMNQLSNHDHSRFLTRTNTTPGRLHTLGHKAASLGINKSVMYIAVTIQMTWPGSPCIYYGDEAGLAGWTDPDNRRTYPWGNEDKELLAFHHDIIAVRREHPALRLGSLEYLLLEDGILCYARTLGNNKTITAINNTDTPITVILPVWKLNIRCGTFARLIETLEDGYNQDEGYEQANSGWLNLTLPPKSSLLLSAMP